MCEDPGLLSLGLFGIAMALHFVVNNFGLRKHHWGDYDRVGRWVLAAAILLGWRVGRLAEIDQVAVALLVAFPAGGVVLDVLKTEGPLEVVVEPSAKSARPIPREK